MVIFFILKLIGCYPSREDLCNIEPFDYNQDDWIIWKERLLTNKNFNKILNEKPPCIIGDEFKRVIGPHGLRIIECFSFQNYDEQNFNVLLRKLDIFFYLRRFPRNFQRDSLEDYINRLKVYMLFINLKWKIIDFYN